MKPSKYQVLSSMPAIYEESYRRLLRLFPELSSSDPSSVSLPLKNHAHLELTIKENCKYTTIIQLRHHMTQASSFIDNPAMTLRAYHDAQMVEAISYQNAHRFKAVYDYPNNLMHQPFEKKQINQFLCDWLKHCISLKEPLPQASTSRQASS